MTIAARDAGVSATAVRRAVRAVLDGEGAGPATVSVTLLSAAAMRALNRRTVGRDRATDVIAFALGHPGRLVGDIYVCPAVARRAVRDTHHSFREEMLRLVVHGTLHALGHDHAEGPSRMRSAMWRRQERYVRGLSQENRR